MKHIPSAGNDCWGITVSRGNYMNRIYISLLFILVSLGWAVNHYRDNAIEFQRQRNDVAEKLSQAKSTIGDMQTRQLAVAALDAYYTLELAKANEQIESLQRDVAGGIKRLQIAANCESTASTGVVNATAPRLTNTAERNYFRLRERIEIARQQIAGLQAYIQQQCFIKKGAN